MWCSTDEKTGRYLCQLYSLSEGFDNLKLRHLIQRPGMWEVDLCTRQDMLTFFLWCLSSSSSCRNNACLRHNVLGALGTLDLGNFMGLLIWATEETFANVPSDDAHTHRINPFRTSLVFLKQRERTRVSGARKSGESWRARLPSSESGKQTLANTSLSSHQFTGSVWCY